MTSKIVSAALAGATALALTAGATSANAATSSATARARVLSALTLTNNRALDFGAVVTSPSAGTVAIDAAGGRTCGGGVTCSGTVSSAAFEVSTGTAGENVTVNADPSVTLTSGGNSMTATLVESATAVLLDATGRATFTVGGTLSVGANQAQGVYSGSFDVTANYQ